MENLYMNAIVCDCRKNIFFHYSDFKIRLFALSTTEVSNDAK